MARRDPVVAIVGRPNVGKSTLFNRILKRRRAVVDDRPGITRDRVVAPADWNGRNFLLIDTGGYTPDSRDAIERAVVEQSRTAVLEADVVILLVDVDEGVNPIDAEIARILRKSGRSTVVAANKVDSARREVDALAFASLGLGDPRPLSGLHGRNVGELLDEVVRLLPETAGALETTAIRIAVVGRPNVGKSSIVNRILHEERMIVHDAPGTTRDAVDSTFSYEGTTYTIVDTAGIRRRSKVDDLAEIASVRMAERAIERADIALVVLDSTEGVLAQDQKIASIAHESGVGIVLAANKWDLVEKDQKTAIEDEKDIREQLTFLSYAPVVFTSALTGQRVFKLLSAAKRVAAERERRLATSALNVTIEKAVERYQPPSGPGKRTPKIFFAAQTGVKPPTFTLYVKNPRSLGMNYRHYLLSFLREHHGFEGTPIHLHIRGKQEKSKPKRRLTQDRPEPPTEASR